MLVRLVAMLVAAIIGIAFTAPASLAAELPRKGGPAVSQDEEIVFIGGPADPPRKGGGVIVGDYDLCNGQDLYVDFNLLGNGEDLTFSGLCMRNSLGEVCEVRPTAAVTFTHTERRPARKFGTRTRGLTEHVITWSSPGVTLTKPDIWTTRSNERGQAWWRFEGLNKLVVTHRGDAPMTTLSMYGTSRATLPSVDRTIDGCS